jgi:outer membrane protein
LQTQIIAKNVSELQLKQVKAARYPVVSLNTGYNFQNTESSLGFTRESSARGFNYGFSATLNIFDGFAQNRNEKIAKLQVENSSLMEEAQTKYNEYQQKQSTWTPAIKSSKEKELGEIQNRIQEFQQSIQAELQQQQQQLMDPIYKKAQEAVEKLAKAGGYLFVFETSQYLYVDKAQCKDLTPEARKAMNIPEGRTLEDLQKELQTQQAQQQQ